MGVMFSIDSMGVMLSIDSRFYIFIPFKRSVLVMRSTFLKLIN